jgi:hypothetical protein
MQRVERQTLFAGFAMMAVNSELPPLADRRATGLRKRAFLGGVVVYADGAHSFACVMRNVTAKGARIGFDTGQILPTHFWLISGRERSAYRARTVWLRPNEAGVAFEAAMALHQLPPELGYLRRFAG